MKMTLNEFNLAKSYYERIDDLDKMIDALKSNPYLIANYGAYGEFKVRISCIDNKGKELSNLILNWCEKEKREIEKMIEGL